ncbi:SOS response-associated peptidase family protein [Paracoccus pantotrophus]|uniref:SOS response-associated peptidase family protein n=1 Tax=Paracoccus pantotrophus TaxID=82367 RepID=UPI001E307CED|nr:SOS response-associated peptidase family protein [Paracoccus pantotrophus]
MVRRSPPQKQVDEMYFPIRAYFHVPKDGLKESAALYAWLDQHIGRPNYAWHAGGSSSGRDQIALYFRTAEALAGFTAAWPRLPLADRVGDPSYTSPHVIRAPGSGRDDQVCHLYNQRRAADEVRRNFDGQVMAVRVGNLEPGEVYPNSPGPIIRHDAGGGLELVYARWGMPSHPGNLKTQRDPGVYNVRNLRSPHWQRWLGPACRCLVPVTSFAETRGPGRGNQWFAPIDPDLPMYFAGIETRGWRSVRRVKDGETEDDLYAFLTCAPSAEVKATNPDSMPVILTKPAEWEMWMSAPLEMVTALQRPLPDGTLQAVDGPI